MKRFLIFIQILLIFAINNIIAQESTNVNIWIRNVAIALNKDLEQGSKIAVLNFSCNSERMARYLIEEFNTSIVNESSLKIIDRLQLFSLREDMNIQLSDALSNAVLQQIGKKLNLKYIISGSVTIMNNIYYIKVNVINVSDGSIKISYSANIQNDSTLSELIKDDSSKASIRAYIKPMVSIGFSLLKIEGNSNTLTTLGFDLDFISTIGLTLGLQNIIAWNTDITTSPFISFGIGYTYENRNNWSIGGKLMFSSFIDRGIGLNINGTWWFDDNFGFIGIMDLYSGFSDTKWSNASIRIGISLKI